MPSERIFDQTAETVGRASKPPCSGMTVRRYCMAGLLEFRRASDGTFLLPRDAAATVTLIRQGRHVAP